MSRTFTVNLCAALLLAAAASPTSAAGLGEGTSAGRPPAAICEHAQEPLQSGRECISPWCLHRDLSDRTVGPTFPTRCGQSAALSPVRVVGIAT
jgi:hypothetical protein